MRLRGGLLGIGIAVAMAASALAACGDSTTNNTTNVTVVSEGGGGDALVGVETDASDAELADDGDAADAQADVQPLADAAACVDDMRVVAACTAQGTPKARGLMCPPNTALGQGCVLVVGFPDDQCCD